MAKAFTALKTKLKELDQARLAARVLELKEREKSLLASEGFHRDDAHRGVDGTMAAARRAYEVEAFKALPLFCSTHAVELRRLAELAALWQAMQAGFAEDLHRLIDAEPTTGVLAQRGWSPVPHAEIKAQLEDVRRELQVLELEHERRDAEKQEAFAKERALELEAEQEKLTAA